MSIASEITRLQQAKADIKTAIENKGVTIPSDATIDVYDDYIDSISGGGELLEDKPVVYIDYDGTILYGYTAEEFAQLTEHPANPDHSGDDIPLTSQGWNWTLADAKTYVAANGYLVIGQMYITTDEVTYIGIDTTKTTSDAFTTSGATIMFYQYGANNVVINWGDGSPTETVSTSGNGARKATHVYSQDGQYIIKLTSLNNGLALSYSFFDNYSSNDRLLLYDAVTFVRYGKTRTGTLGKIGRRNLETITIPDGEFNPYNYFAQLSKLQAIIIPSGSTSLGANSFEFATNLKYASLPKSVATINNSVFNNCYNLRLITLPSTMTTIGTSIFTYCSSLKTAILPNTVTSFGTSSLFSNCYSLEEIKLPTNITTYPVLQNCISLKVTQFPSTITTIPSSALYNCPLSETITLPSSVTTINASAFAYCRFLKNLVLPNNITILNGSTARDCWSLETLTLPSSLKTIGTYEFSSCYNLKSLTLPSTLETIGAYAFQSCHSLKNITIPNNVTTIGNYAFANCTSVETITIGEKVTSIGTITFSAGSRKSDTLQAIYVLPQTPPTIANNSFYNLGNAFTIYVPAGKLSVYQTAQYWSTFASIMQEMTT